MSYIDEQQSVDYYNNRPGIRVGGGVLIFNEQHQLLILKPNYRNTWLWPGGGWEPGESPQDVALRECEEEIGIRLTHLEPAFVNYIPPRSDGSKDVIHFVYTTTPVNDGFFKTLVLQKSEIEDAMFVSIAEMDRYMKEYRVRALNTYLKHRVAGAMLYLQDGLLSDASKTL